ncbi:MAG: glycosyltransferase [Bacteriovorax sp.]|jgi:glycosyltransferase involved in cell wall biosynthesis
MKNKNPLISIILRSYNEEKWIGACLDAIMAQNYKNFEIILVDNNSTDLTVSKARQYPVKVVNLKEFKPGYSLNLGIRESKGEYLVCISAHCIPTNEHWLGNLLKAFDTDKVAAVYGRQEPMSFTTDFDKRDLLTIFGLDKKVQWKDSFFHNANSMLRRDLWEKIPFDEEILNIEDRLWAREILKLGYCIVYEPEASVYHWHGVHQNQNAERCKNVVRIIEGLYREDGQLNTLDMKENLKVTALIPVKGEILKVDGVPLLKHTIDYLKKSKRVNSIVVTTDSKEYAELARSLGIETVIERDASLSKEFVDLMTVYQDAIIKMEKLKIVPDIIVPMEITFPLREASLIDDMIKTLVDEGHDSVIPVKAEFGSAWKKEDKHFEMLLDGFVPRKFKDPLWIGIKGLGIATYPGKILKGNIMSGNVKLFEVHNPLSSIELRNKDELALAAQLMKALN